MKGGIYETRPASWWGRMQQQQQQRGARISVNENARWRGRSERGGVCATSYTFACTASRAATVRLLLLLALAVVSGSLDLPRKSAEQWSVTGSRQQLSVVVELSLLCATSTFPRTPGPRDSVLAPADNNAARACTWLLPLPALPSLQANHTRYAA